jgi:hypothetical protein
MARRKRLAREAPRRTAPIRNSVIGAPSDAALSSVPLTLSDAVNQSLKAAERLTATADATVKGAVERGVDTAYMVIEEYMRRGQEAASRFRQRNGGGRSDMNDDQQRFGPFGNASGPMGPIFAPWMQAMRMWTDAMATFAAGGGPTVDLMNRFLAGFAVARPKISVEVSSQYPTEVIVALDPGAELTKLTAEPLVNGDDKNAPPLAGTVMECATDVVRVRLTVPNDQPAGQYRGAIKDPLGIKRGELVAHVKGSPTAKPRARRRRGK